MTAMAVAAIAIFAALTLNGVVGRRDATERLSSDHAPLVLGAQRLYVALADADAAASTAFLRAGREPEDLRQRYRQDIRLAGRLVVDIAARPELTARAAVTSIAEELPEYDRLVEAARTNNRLEHPVGAAYLRRASDLMRDSILPAATRVYEQAARQIDAGYRAGTSTGVLTGVLVTGTVAIVALIAAQLFLTVRTRRALNLGLAASTVLVAAAIALTLIQLGRQRDGLVRAQREGADRVITLSTARILMLRSLSDENLDLIERGTNEQDDFDAQVAAIGGENGTGGLLAAARASAPDETAREGVLEIQSLFGDYLDTHADVRRLVDAGGYVAAVDVALSNEAGVAARLGDAMDEQIDQASRSLDAGVVRAHDRVDLLPAGLAALTVLAVVTALAGVAPRLREYR